MTDANRFERLCPRPRWMSWVDAGPPPEHALPPQGYRLRIRDGRPTVVGADDAGAFYGWQTWRQLQQVAGEPVPDGDVVDWPDLTWRGVMLDVSRDKVPTVETLELLIDRLAGLKVNHVELYLEHTFAHPGHDAVWRDASPFTADDIRRLQVFCAERHVDLVPQQNCLGHMERWLRHDHYAHLAALPGGYRNEHGGEEPAACLDPEAPGAFELAAELVSNVATAFDGQRVHVGLDEPIDWNPAVWDAIFDVPGAPVPWAHVDNGAFCVPLPDDRRAQYLDWIRRLRALPALDGREMLMWADVMAPHPELLDELPDHVALVEWGYEATHPFDARCGRIAAAGRPFWVAPGTSSWSSLTGRTTNMTGNIRAAVAAALLHGAEGLLVCDWGNEGHFQYLPFSWPGFVTGAALGWNAGASLDVADAIGRFLAGETEGDAGLGQATWALGGVHDLVSPQIPEAGTLAALLSSPDVPVGLAAFGMTEQMLVDARAALDIAVDQAMSSPSSVADAAIWRDEVSAAAAWLRLGIDLARHRLGWEGDPGAEALRAEHARLVEEHRRLWLARNRPGGLDDSVARLARIVETV
jgi:hexosaminidase